MPNNYVMNVLNGAASKLAEQAASAKPVLPWLLSAIGISTDAQPVLMLILGEAVLWAMAAMTFAAVEDAPEAVAGGRNMLKESMAGWHLLRREGWFLRFLFVRASLLSVELAGPFMSFTSGTCFRTRRGCLA